MKTAVISSLFAIGLMSGAGAQSINTKDMPHDLLTCTGWNTQHNKPLGQDEINIYRMMQNVFIQGYLSALEDEWSANKTRLLPTKPPEIARKVEAISLLCKAFPNIDLSEAAYQLADISYPTKRKKVR